MPEQLHPDFAVSERNLGGVRETVHGVKALILLLRQDEHGFAVNFCQLADR